MFGHPLAPRKLTPEPKLHDVKRRLTADEQAELQAAYAAGASSRTVGQRFGVDRKAVIRLAAEAGLARTRPRLTADQIAEVTSRYEAGESTPQLAKRFGIGVTTVLRVLRSSGVAVRPRRGARLPPSPPGVAPSPALPGQADGDQCPDAPRP